jgi:restriction system protein
MKAWLSRSGQSGEREQWALESGHTGGGFGEIPSLLTVDTWEAMLSIVTGQYPPDKEAMARNFASQLWALRGRMAVGDLVVMPLKASQHIAIGVIDGEYEYLNDADQERRHVRRVKWQVVDVPRTAIKQDLLYSLGAFMTVCEISRNDAVWRLGEVRRTGSDPGSRTPTKSGKSVPGEAVDASNEATDVSQDDVEIESYAKDKITRHIIENFAGHGLTTLVRAILTAEGFVCEQPPPGPDQGVDIVAGTGLFGLDAPRLIVQVKSEATAVGDPVVQQLEGVVSRQGADQGLLVAWGGVTRQARQVLNTRRFKVKVWDSEDVLEGLFRNYPRLDPDIKSLLPLKQVWTLVE